MDWKYGIKAAGKSLKVYYNNGEDMVGYMMEFSKEFVKEVIKEFGKEYGKDSCSKNLEKTKKILQNERKKSY